jgi:hypothetical protein
VGQLPSAGALPTRGRLECTGMVVLRDSSSGAAVAGRVEAPVLLSLRAWCRLCDIDDWLLAFDVCAFLYTACYSPSSGSAVSLLCFFSFQSLGLLAEPLTRAGRTERHTHAASYAGTSVSVMTPGCLWFWLCSQNYLSRRYICLPKVHNK